MNEIMKLIGFVHILDGMQGTCSGIMRSMGAQLVVSIFLFVAFYVFGLPVGISLLLKTSLKLEGYFLGISAGMVILIIMQNIYIFRIDWVVMASKVRSRFQLNNLLLGY